MRDYWWVKALLYKEAKRIAKEAREDGREVMREHFARVKGNKQRNGAVVRGAEEKQYPAME